MEKNNSKSMSEDIRKQNIAEEVKEAVKTMNMDAPYADVDPEVADVPESVVKDL